jgi:hypothetical protein
MALGESRELVSPARGSGDMTGTEMSASLLDFDLTDFYHLRSIQWLIEHLFAHAKYPHYDMLAPRKATACGSSAVDPSPGTTGF